MKKCFTKFIAISVIAAILLTFSGCFIKSHKAVMRDYLENKYGEEFVPIYYSSENWAYSYDSLFVHPKGKEDQTFNVQGDMSKTRKYICRDNYFQYIIRDDYENVMSDFVKEYFKDFKIYMNKYDGMCDDDLNYGVNVSEIYDKDKNFIGDFNLFIKKSEIDKKMSMKFLIKLHKKE